MVREPLQPLSAESLGVGEDFVFPRGPNPVFIPVRRSNWCCTGKNFRQDPYFFFG